MRSGDQAAVLAQAKAEHKKEKAASGNNDDDDEDDDDDAEEAQEDKAVEESTNAFQYPMQMVDVLVVKPLRRKFSNSLDQFVKQRCFTMNQHVQKQKNGSV